MIGAGFFLRRAERPLLGGGWSSSVAPVSIDVCSATSFGAGRAGINNDSPRGFPFCNRFENGERVRGEVLPLLKGDVGGCRGVVGVIPDSGEEDLSDAAWPLLSASSSPAAAIDCVEANHGAGVEGINVMTESSSQGEAIG